MEIPGPRGIDGRTCAAAAVLIAGRFRAAGALCARMTRVGKDRTALREYPNLCDSRDLAPVAADRLVARTGALQPFKKAGAIAFTGTRTGKIAMTPRRSKPIWHERARAADGLDSALAKKTSRAGANAL